MWAELLLPRVAASCGHSVTWRRNRQTLAARLCAQTHQLRDPGGERVTGRPLRVAGAQGDCGSHCITRGCSRGAATLSARPAHEMFCRGAASAVGARVLETGGKNLTYHNRRKRLRGREGKHRGAMQCRLLRHPSVGVDQTSLSGWQILCPRRVVASRCPSRDAGHITRPPRRDLPACLLQMPLTEIPRSPHPWPPGSSCRWDSVQRCGPWLGGLFLV